jgi:hypothetical protein
MIGRGYGKPGNRDGVALPDLPRLSIMRRKISKKPLVLQPPAGFRTARPDGAVVLSDGARYGTQCRRPLPFGRCAHALAAQVRGSRLARASPGIADIQIGKCWSRAAAQHQRDLGPSQQRRHRSQGRVWLALNDADLPRSGFGNIDIFKPQYLRPSGL